MDGARGAREKNLTSQQNVRVQPCIRLKVVAIALANKLARIAWALLASGGHYRPARLAAA
jgi:hypothetical protein